MGREQEGQDSRSDVCEEGLTGSSRTSQCFFLLSRLPSSQGYVTTFLSTLSTVSQFLPKRKRDGPQMLLSTFRIIYYYVPEIIDSKSFGRSISCFSDNQMQHPEITSIKLEEHHCIYIIYISVDRDRWTTI